MTLVRKIASCPKEGLNYCTTLFATLGFLGRDFNTDFNSPLQTNKSLSKSLTDEQVFHDKFPCGKFYLLVYTRHFANFFYDVRLLKSYLASGFPTSALVIDKIGKVETCASVNKENLSKKIEPNNTLASDVLCTLCKHHGDKQQRLNCQKKTRHKKLLCIHTYTWQSKVVIKNCCRKLACL